MTVCNRLSDACTNLRVFREESTNLSQAHARLIVVVNQPLTDGRGIISIFQHTSGKTAAKKNPQSI